MGATMKQFATATSMRSVQKCLTTCIEGDRDHPLGEAQDIGITTLIPWGSSNWFAGIIDAFQSGCRT